MTFIDISVSLSNNLPIWPGSPGFDLQWLHRIEDGGFSNNSKMTMDIHTGTHIDAPLHFIEEGISVAYIELEKLIGPVWVVDFTSRDTITDQYFEMSGIPTGVNRLLLKTDNSQLWSKGTDVFIEDYVSLTEPAARWVVENKICLIGIDYLSIQRYHDGPEVHQILLENEVVILEGLNLFDVNEGLYELICLPLRIEDAEGAPARAILKY